MITVFLLLGLLALGTGLGGVFGGPAGLPASPTPPAVLDEFARLALDHVRGAHMVERGTPQVLVSRRILPGDRPCLGLDPIYFLPAVEPLQVVILQGHFTMSDMPGTQVVASQDVHYLVYTFLVRTRQITGEQGSDRGDGLQWSLQDPNLPIDDPVFRGSGWGGELDIARIVEARQGQALSLAQTVGGWTVTLQRVYADANRVVVAYGVQGPRGTRRLDPPILTDSSGRSFPLLGASADVRTDPPVGLAWFDSAGRLPAGPAVPLRLRFGAVYVRAARPLPPAPPCGLVLTPPPAVPAAATLAPGAPFTPAPLPAMPTPFPRPPPAAEVPDVALGPFTFALTIPVAPATPLPSVPAPLLPAPGGKP